MEINYDMILRYLSPQNKFKTAEHIHNKEFPDSFKTYLNEEFYRLGTFDGSFFTAFLSLVNKTYFKIIDNTQKTTQNKELINYLSLKSQSIKDKIDTTIDDEILTFISKFSNVNILIFDYNTNIIKPYYCDDKLNPWRPMLLIANKDKEYEPILMKDKNKQKKLFSINDNCIKKILSSLLIDINIDINSVCKNNNDINYSKMTRAQIMKILDEKGIKYLKKLTKDELVKLVI